MEKKTPLYEMHVRYGGKIVSFGGYLLPVQYKTGVKAEHMAVRTGCGIFDVSHMGEILCEGEGARSALNMILTNDFTNMKDGQARYSVMCCEDGGCIDDLIVYKKEEGKYFIVVNAANKDIDFAWMKDHEEAGAAFTDVSDQYAQIAIQGPESKEILNTLFPEAELPEKYYTANFSGEIEGISCILSKTGYTGSDGYEIYLPAEAAPGIWEILVEKGALCGLIPCGLGARDTLRLEAGMPLYGHEMDRSVTPLEAGLGFAVKMDKDDFIGKKALAEKPVTRKRVGLKVTGKGIVREHMDVYLEGEKIGHTTSGTAAPYLGYPVAMALIEKSCAETGKKLIVDVRGKMVETEIVPLPFYKK